MDSISIFLAIIPILISIYTLVSSRKDGKLKQQQIDALVSQANEQKAQTKHAENTNNLIDNYISITTKRAEEQNLIDQQKTSILREEQELQKKIRKSAIMPTLTKTAGTGGNPTYINIVFINVGGKAKLIGLKLSPETNKKFSIDSKVGMTVDNNATIEVRLTPMQNINANITDYEFELFLEDVDKNVYKQVVKREGQMSEMGGPEPSMLPSN
jgi:hypothetical protein